MSDDDWIKYLKACRPQKLLMLQAEWEKETNSNARSFLEGRMLELSIGLNEHPEGFEHGCLCDLCCSYA
jgi:hypothetical protein